MRSSEIASFFFKHGFALPDQKDSIVLDDALDYQDVKLKIVQQEGYDAHDFNLFDDRSSVLWRKPYIDGAVRELTRSRPPAATYISRARARHPGPLVSHARHVTAARSLLFRLPSLWFFQLRSVCTEFRTSGPQQSPKSAVRSAEFRTHGPHSTKIPHPFRTLFRILDGLEPVSICFVFRTGLLGPRPDQACCSVWSGQHAQKLHRSRFCRPLYIVSRSAARALCIYWMDGH